MVQYLTPCMYVEFTVLNICVFVAYLCAGCVCSLVFLLTHSYKDSSRRGSVAQTADENIQGAEPPGHSNKLVGLILISKIISKIMIPFTALKKLYFTSPHFSFVYFFTYPIKPSLHFTLLYMSTTHLTSLHFLHLSPPLPLTDFHFPNPRFENMPLTVLSPCRPFR